MHARRQAAATLFTLLAFAAWIAPAAAGVTIYEKDDTKVEFGARIQLQYANVNSVDNERTDRIFFRRLRPYIAGTVTKNWWGVIAIDFGQNLNENELQIKDAYIRYNGWEEKRMRLTIGNTKPPFSRTFLTSSKRLQMVERGFTGDHNFGVPERALGVRFDQAIGEKKKLDYSAFVGAVYHDPAMNRMDLDSPANDEGDWNQGGTIVGRLDISPRGPVPYSQGDFHTDPLTYVISVAGYGWKNDGDNNTYTGSDGITLDPTEEKVDLDRAYAFEVSGGVRGFGWSGDLEYNQIHGDLVDKTFTGGLYKNGATTLRQFNAVGGYMVLEESLEVTARYQHQDADNYRSPWTSTTLGVNYFWNKYKVKFQFNYSFSQNFLGIRGDNLDIVQGQMQFVF